MIWSETAEELERLVEALYSIGSRLGGLKFLGE